MITIPTEAIGSFPRSDSLIQAQRQYDDCEFESTITAGVYDEAVQLTMQQLEATGSPIITDGEKYCVEGGENFGSDGIEVSCSDGHVRRLPRLTEGPFRYVFCGDLLCNGIGNGNEIYPFSYKGVPPALCLT